MFKQFQSTFDITSKKENTLISINNIPFKYSELILELGGSSFDKGLYSTHTFEDSIKWSKEICNYFSKDDGSILSFAHDWLGNEYCVPASGNEKVIMFDPATHQEFYVEENLFDFHNKTLSYSKVESLSADFFEDSLKHLNIKQIDYTKCLGFKIPLFLGRKEETSNYEVSDLTVYWE